MDAPHTGNKESMRRSQMSALAICMIERSLSEGPHVFPAEPSGKKYQNGIVNLSRIVPGDMRKDRAGPIL